MPLGRVRPPEIIAGFDVADAGAVVLHPRSGFGHPLPRQPFPIRVHGLLDYRLAEGVASYPDLEYARRIFDLSIAEERIFWQDLVVNALEIRVDFVLHRRS